MYTIYYNHDWEGWCNISGIPEPDVTWTTGNTAAFMPENKTSTYFGGSCGNTPMPLRLMVWATDSLDVRKAAANTTMTCSGGNHLDYKERTIRVDVQCKFRLMPTKHRDGSTWFKTVLYHFKPSVCFVGSFECRCIWYLRRNHNLL